MNITTVFLREVLNLSDSWTVSSFELHKEQEQLDIWLSQSTNAVLRCPVCGRELVCYDHTPTRKWRHLNVCEYETYLYASIPRVKCPEHGTKQVSIPWAEKLSRFSIKMEAYIIDQINSCDNITEASRMLNIEWHVLLGIMKCAVNRWLSRRNSDPPENICVDEKAYKKGHSYMTIVYDGDRH